MWNDGPHEDQRQYAEARRFLVLCPDFNPNDAALCNQLIDEVEARGITMTAEALASAWCQYKGVADPFEPKVMKAIDFAPPQDVQFMDLGDVKWKWKPMSTGLGWLKEWEDVVAPEHPKPEEKPVASMPTSWYSGDVVEINTGRRIKDDD
jgi:hypothetical protein